MQNGTGQDSLVDAVMAKLRLYGPHGLALVSALVVGALIWKVATPTQDKPHKPRVKPDLMVLQTQAAAQAALRPGLTSPTSVPVQVKSGETLSQALLRTGIPAEQARMAVQLLSDSMDTVNIKAGLNLQAVIAKPTNRKGNAHLLGLSMRTSPSTAVTLSTQFDGNMTLHEMEEKIREERTVAIGQIEGSLYSSAARLGATPTITAKVAKLFAHKLDFERDIHAGDQFKLVFDRKLTESGRTTETGDLLFAEIHAKGGTTRFYRFKPKGADEAQYFDETGKNIRGLLLRTPVDNARQTSSFGMRRHPIQGYQKMHQGIDFGAGMGTPILAAGDGVVVEARRWGGYGNWIRIRHSNGWETGYAHTSRYAQGIRAGMKVRQGQVIAYVGSTGASTGPHLHYEVWQNGQRINPVGAKVPQGTILAGSDLAGFKSMKTQIDTMVIKQEHASVEGRSRRG